MTGKHLRIKPMGDNALGVTLEGDKRKPEPDYFRVHFPGGAVDIARCGNGDYWVHLLVFKPGDSDVITGDEVPATITDARLDIKGKPTAETDAGDFAHPGLYHVALRVTR